MARGGFDGLEMKELCFNAHSMGDLTWLLVRLHRAMDPMQHWGGRSKNYRAMSKPLA